MNTMMKTLLVLGTLAASGAASATSYYVCSSGSDSNSGTSSSAPWQSLGKAQQVINNTAGGDQLLFCKGGVWSGGQGFDWTNAKSSATQSNPFVIDSYGTGNAPLLQFSGTAFYLSSYNPIAGLTIRNLDIRGPGTVTDTYGLFVFGSMKYVTVDSMNIQGFHFGFASPQDGAAVKSSYITVKNSTFYKNRNAGAFIATANTTFENNTFNDNGGCAGGSSCQPPALRHSLYVGGASDGSTQNIVIRGNTSTKASYAAGYCEGTHITGHGIIKNILLENNLVYETNKSGAGCYGIGYGDNYGQNSEGTTGYIARGNTVVNVGNQYFTWNASPGIIVENNVAIVTGATYAEAFGSRVKNVSTSLNTTNATFRNNSVYFASGSSGTAFAFDAGTGTGNVVANNLVSIAGGSASCFSTGSKAASDFTYFNTNLCNNAGSGGLGGIASLLTNILTAAPQFVSGAATSPSWSLAIQSTSPAKDAGNNTYCSATDKAGHARDTKCDIGAYEVVGGTTNVAPAAPTALKVQ